MNRKSQKKGLKSRYSVKKEIGEYPPWKGYNVTDSLSGRDYLLFSLNHESKLKICQNDLVMRDFLFSSRKGLAPAALSLQEANNGITFLLTLDRIVPMADALTGMKEDRAYDIFKAVATEILTAVSSGLFYDNLSPESLVMAGDNPVILPVAYLLPGMIARYGFARQGEKIIDPLLNDLAALGRIFGIFAEHLPAEAGRECLEVSRELVSLVETPVQETYYSLMRRAVRLAGVGEELIPPLTLLTMFDNPGGIVMRKLRQKAFKARDGENHLVIINGTPGEGRTSFLNSAIEQLRHEWGLKGSGILGDQMILQDFESTDDNTGEDFVVYDDHMLDPLLYGHIVDRLSRDLEHHRLVLMTGGTDSGGIFPESVRAEGIAAKFRVDEIELPPLTGSEKTALLESLLPPSAGELIDPDAASENTLAGLFLSLRSHLFSLSGDRPGEEGTTRSSGTEVRYGSELLDALSAEERSILSFLAVFRFEVPLTILQSVYSTEENHFYSVLHRLVSSGFVSARAEISVLSKNKLCMVFSISSKTLADSLRESMPRARRKELHRNIAHILKESHEAPLVYIFYHLTSCGQYEDAAFKGMEIFHVLLGRRKVHAIGCFNDFFMSMKLDRYLPAEMRFKFYLELGDYFSHIGNIDKAEQLYRKCREELGKSEEWQTLRDLATAAIRRECEILEKRGDFKKAESLLKKALETHGEHILSSERAKLYNDLAWVHYRLGQLNESWANCLIVHKIIDKKQNPKELSQSFSLMGAINWNRSKYDEAVICHKNCLALREECNDETGMGASYNNLGLVYRSMGRMKDSLDSFTRSMKIKQKDSNIPGLAVAHLNLALVYIDLEEIEKAEKNCQIAMKLAQDMGNQQLLAEIWGTTGEIFFLKGDYDSARKHYFQDLHICHKTKSLREKAIVFRRLGELSLAEGKLTETTELLTQARTLNARIGSRLETILLDLLEGRILLAQGKREGGRLMLEGTSFELSLLGRKRIAASVTAEIGELYLEEGNEHLAREYLLRAISLVSEIERVPKQVKHLQEHLDQRTSLESDRIDSDSRRFRALCRVISFIRTINEPEKLYDTVTETARRITEMERAALILQNDDRETFRFLSSLGDFESESILTDKNIIAILNITRQLGYTLDLSRSNIPEGRISSDFIGSHPGIICTPLWIQDEVTGFLYLDSSRKRAEASSEDHSFIVAFSQQVALGLERIFLNEQVREAEKKRYSPPTIVTKSENRVTFRDIIGKSPAMRHVYELIDSIKDMDTTVLLTGPNGSGKDLIVRAIHDTGPRHNKPFHHLNCAAFPHSLLESEIFGHEKGAFTGAIKQKVGHFEKASDGTIYLNEIGEMPLSLQPKLLRVLEERKFFRVGGTKEINTNARIITATNRNLQQLVKQGSFREDLFYRINIFPIKIPALRERREDISLLCNHFLTTFCRVYNTPMKRISPEAMTYLNEYEWPGNVRELENTIKRLIIISRKDTILPEDLPESIITHTETVHAQALTTLEDVVESLLDSVEYSVDDPVLPKIEKSIVKKVVDQTGDKQKAAKILGISKPTLYSWLKKYEE